MNSTHINLSCSFKWESKILICLSNFYKNVSVKNKNYSLDPTFRLKREYACDK